VTTNVTTGCSDELSSFGFQANDTSTLIGIVQAVYPAVRQIVCLKESVVGSSPTKWLLILFLNSTSANQLCVTETLTGIQNSFGTLSASGIEKIFTDLFSGKTTVPKSITCSDCTKASYNILKTNFPDYVTDLTSNLSTECGSSFVGEVLTYNLMCLPGLIHVLYRWLKPFRYLTEC
jgi:hypothetical protein